MLVGPPRRAHERSQRPLDPEPVALEVERVRVAARQRVLDIGTRRQLGARRQVEKRPDLGHHPREAVVHSTSIISPRAAQGMGRRAYLRHRLGPCLALVAVLLAVAAPARAADATLTTRLAKALAVPHVDPARTAALAIDLRTGAVVFERNASLSLVPASNQKLPVAYAALALLGPAYRFHTEVVGSGTLVGDVWHGDLWLRGFGDPTLEASDLDAPRGRGRRLGDPARRRRRDRGRVLVRRAPDGAGVAAELLPLRVAAALRPRRRPGLVSRPDVGEPRAGGGVAAPTVARGRRASRSEGAPTAAC